MRDFILMPALTVIALVLAACTVGPLATRGADTPAPIFAGTINTAAAPIVIEGRGSDTIPGARAYVNRVMAQAFREGRPVRLSGRFVSGGTAALFIAENVPGSCIDADAQFGFHRTVQGVSLAIGVPVPLEGPRGDLSNEALAETYNDALAREFLDGIEAGRITGWFTDLTGAELATRFGYEICDG
jgi:hypothetical protein